MNSFSERSYKAALLTKKEKLSSEQGSDSKTKREVAAAPSAPLTAPTVQRPTPPTPIVIESSPSDAFTTPKSNSRENSREKRARALTMSSHPKKLDLPKVESQILKEAIKQRKEEKEGSSRTHPICVEDNQDAGQHQPKRTKTTKKQVSAVEKAAVNTKNKKQTFAAEKLAISSRKQKQEAGSPSKAHILATIKKNKRRQQESGQQQDEDEDADEQEHEEADEDEDADEQEYEEADEDEDADEQEHEEAEEDEDAEEQEQGEADENEEGESREHGDGREVLFISSSGTSDEERVRDAEEPSLPRVSNINSKSKRKEHSKLKERATSAPPRPSPRQPNTRRNVGGNEVENNEVEEDGIWLWSKKQIMSDEEWKRQVKKEQNQRRKEAEEQEGKQHQEDEGDEFANTYTPSHRAHLLKRIREATGVEQEEANLALGAALRRWKTRMPTAVIERACQVVMENFQKRITKNLADAVEAKRKSIKIKRRNEEQSEEDEADQISGKRRREEGTATGGSIKATRTQEPLSRPQRTPA